MRQLAYHAVAGCSPAPAPTAPVIRCHDPAHQRRPIRPHKLQPQRVQATERRQVRAGEGNVRHVEVFRLGGVRTPHGLARDIRINTGYSRAADEAHNLARMALKATGDIQTGPGTLTITLDPLPTARATTAIRELADHLTATQTRYPGTNLVLHYKVKNRH